VKLDKELSRPLGALSGARCVTEDSVKSAEGLCCTSGSAAGACSGSSAKLE